MNEKPQDEVIRLQDKIVMLQPYVAPEYQRLLSDAEAQFSEYSSWLASSLKPKEISGTTIKTRWGDKEMAEAKNSFLSDPIRLAMIKNLVMIKVLVEQPRFLLSAEPLIITSNCPDNLRKALLYGG